jgi:hypothetical protein
MDRAFVRVVLLSVGVVLTIGLLLGARTEPPRNAAYRAPVPVVSPTWREGNIQEFRAQLDVFHPNDQFSTTAVDLEDGVENLIRSGVPRDDAFKSMLIVVQNPAINPATAYSIADMGRKIAAIKNGQITGPR